MDKAETLNRINTVIAGDSELNQTYGYLNTLGLSSETILEKLSLLSTLKESMKDGVANFVFKKVNGEIRNAFGTRAADVLTTHNDTPSGRRKNTPSTFSYYDIEKGAWRCFKPEYLMEICTNYTI